MHKAPLVVRQTRNGSVRPFIRAHVAGKPLMLLVDTGAVQSMLPASFARANGMRTAPSASDAHTVDANGRMTRMPILPDVSVQFEGASGVARVDFLMNPSAPDDEAILAPQDLVAPGWALVIDLDRAELSYEAEEAALEAASAGGARLREVDFSRCLHEGLWVRTHRFVPMTVNGIAAKMMIDTGAERTSLARNHPAIPSMVAMMGQRGTVVGVASRGQKFVVDEIPLVFAETPFVASVQVLPASSPCGHGAVGADVLRRCTIVWGWSSLWAACRGLADGDSR